MRAILLENIGQLKAIQLEKPIQLGPNEALVKVHKIGICGTDIHAFKGRQPFFTYPRILGHELGVEVIEIGEKVTQVKVGDRCAVEPYFNKTMDQAVRRGKTNCGENISVFGVHEDGECVRYLRLMPNTCIPLPYCALNNWR
jgi:threonine dehydrogenase-like Zn-dependent dehydrogenase